MPRYESRPFDSPARHDVPDEVGTFPRLQSKCCEYCKSRSVSGRGATGRSVDVRLLRFPRLVLR